MRIYGRTTDAYGNKTWTTVTTDNAGYNDYVYVVNLIQVLLLNTNESPFYANYGIPAQLSVIQQVFPDYYLTLTQQQFAPYFASLSLAKIESATPYYKINVITQQGVSALEYVPVPQ